MTHDARKAERSRGSDAAEGALAPTGTDWSRFAQPWQRVFALALWAVLVVTYLLYSRANDLGPLAAAQAIAGLLASTAWGPLIYIAVYAVRPLLFFSSTVLTLTGGFIFGPVWGVVYTVVASNLSASVAYGLARYFGDGLPDLAQMGEWAARYTARMRHNSFTTVLTMRMIFLPYDLVSYFAGLLRIGWRAFILASALGTFPGTITFVLAGSSLEGGLDGKLPGLNPWSLAISGVVFGVSIVLSRVIKRREQEC